MSLCHFNNNYLSLSLCPLFNMWGLRRLWISSQQMSGECWVSLWSAAEKDRIWTSLQKQSECALYRYFSRNIDSLVVLYAKPIFCSVCTATWPYVGDWVYMVHGHLKWWLFLLCKLSSDIILEVTQKVGLNLHFITVSTVTLAKYQYFSCPEHIIPKGWNDRVFNIKFRIILMLCLHSIMVAKPLHVYRCKD